MKLAFYTALALGCMAPMGVAAQDAPSATQAAPKFSGHTPIEALIGNADAKAVMQKYLPDIELHPAYDMFKSMSLRDVQPMSEGALTLEMIAKIEEDLAKIK